MSESLLQNASPNSDAMLINGHGPKPGQVIKLPLLASTFKMLGENGKPGFYTGPVAESIVELIQSKGGLMSLEDLASHTSTEIEPISISYGGATLYEVCTAPFSTYQSFTLTLPFSAHPTDKA